MSTTSLLQTACMTGKRTGRLAVGLLAVIVFLASLAVSDQAFAHAALIKTTRPTARCWHRDRRSSR